MIQFFVKQISIVFPTIIGVTFTAFVLIRLIPGDPVLMLVGERGASPEVIAEMRKNLGLDQPLATQYLSFLSRAFQGDLGNSIVSKRPVVEEFFDRFPATLELGFSALLFAVMIGFPLGLLAAIKRNSFFDYLFMGASLIGYSMPIFWWGLILILFFSVGLGLTPVSGRINVIYDITPVTGFMLIDTLLSEEGFESFISAIKHLILPSIAMGTIPLAVFARMTRACLLEVLEEDYMRTARAKGMSFLRVVFVHGLRNALIPIVTVFGLMVGSIITGAILTESIFSWPGIGKWIVKSVEARDYPVIQGGVFCIGLAIVLVNISVDLIYLLVNPKMRGKK